MKKILILSLLGFTFLCSTRATALVPIESLILGDISSQYQEKESDPLAYIFRPDASVGVENKTYRQQLGAYLGVAQEGKNLDNLCKTRPQIQYRSVWNKEQVKRSAVATLQYVGLDLTVRAIGKYAKFLEIPPEQYENMTDQLVGNYCSPNLTVISLRELKRNFKVKYEQGDFELPSIKDNPLFPQKLSSLNKIDEAVEQELLQTVKLFRALCSWGGDVDDLRLLVPLVRHPVVMAFVARQMGGKKIVWKDEDKSIRMIDDRTTPKILCENMICRKRNNEYYLRSIPFSLGSEGIDRDVSFLYCNEFRDADYNKNPHPQIKKWIDKKSFDDDNLMIGQFIALVTGIPDFFVRSKNFNDAQDFLRMSVDRSFDEWSQDKTANFSKDLYYEEGLMIEKVERSLFFREDRPNFKVVLDVNMGEIDRANQMVGKISVAFNLQLSKNLLASVRQRWADVDPRKEREQKDVIVAFLKNHVAEQIEGERKKFIIPPWKGDLDGIIVRELLDQLVSYRGNFFTERDRSLVTIPVVFNYAPFALRYIANEFLIEKQKEKAKALKVIDEKLGADRRNREETQRKMQTIIDD